MTWAFETRAVVAEAEALIAEGQKTASSQRYGFEFAAKLADLNKQSGQGEKAAFYHLVALYCFVVGVIGGELAERYRRTLKNGVICAVPSADFMGFGPAMTDVPSGSSRPGSNPQHASDNS